jgi:hypothetical protein
VVNDEPNLRRHASLIERMGKNGVSSDESDSETGSPAKAFRIISPTWRSLELKTFLRGLDPLVLDRARPIIGERKRRGQPPRLRILRTPEDQNDLVPAPRGLPRNCYATDWYEDLPGWAQRALLVEDHDHDFLGVVREAAGGK